MRTTLLVPLLLGAGLAAAPAAAQITIGGRGGALLRGVLPDDPKRAVMGVTVSTGSARDTLGVLVSSVTAGSPAEKAGIGEGDRIASINGVNLKLAAADVGDPDMADALSRRLTREMDKVKPGDEVDLKVNSNGQTKTIKLKTVSAADLNAAPAGTVRRMARAEPDNRAALGIALGSTGSKRDTLGVLVMGLDDDGPAAKAGMEEGNRIASINGVNLRVSSEDAGDEMISSSRVNRLEREIEKLKPGDDVTLQVYADGHFKTVKFKAAKASDLKSRTRMFMFPGAGDGRVFRFSPGTMELEGNQMRDAMNRAMEQLQLRLEPFRELKVDTLTGLRTLRDRLRTLELRIPRIRIWTNDDSTNTEPTQIRHVIRHSASAA